MSAHLIQPIEIDGNMVCPFELVLTSLQITGPNTADINEELEFPNLIVLSASDIAGDGEFSVGYSCEDEYTYNFNAEDFSTTPDFYCEIQIYINGVASGSPIGLTSGSPLASGSIPLSDLPCGNVITLAATVTRDSLEPDASDGAFYLLAYN